MAGAERGDFGGEETEKRAGGSGAEKWKNDNHKKEKYKELKGQSTEEKRRRTVKGRERGVNTSFKAISARCNTKQREAIMDIVRCYQAENMIQGSCKKHKAD